MSERTDAAFAGANHSPSATDDRLAVVCAVAVVLSAAFAAYISFVPFDFRRLTDEQIGAALFNALLPSIPSRTNFVANVVLFVPIGFFGGGALRIRHRSAIGAGLLLIVLLLCSTLFSALIESVQIFLPGRTASSTDVVAQAAGTLIGLGLWMLVAHDMSAWYAKTRHSSANETLVLLLKIYVLVRCIALLAPLDVTLSLSTLAEKYRRGAIILRPFDHQSIATGLVQELATDILFSVPFGALAVVGWTASGRRRSVPVATFLATMVLAGLEACQVIIVSRVADVTDILAGAVGAALGAWGAARFATAPSTSVPARRTRSVPVALLIASLVMYALYNWSPFDFRLDKELLKERWPALVQVPFYNYYVNTELQALSEFVLKIAMTVPIGLLAEHAVGGAGRRAFRQTRLVGTLFASALFFLLIEIGQIFLPSRFPDITDVLIGTLGVAVGLTVTRSAQR